VGKTSFYIATESSAVSMYWGRIVNKGVSRFDFGDSHLIFMTEGNKVYGIGNNKFGQLGYH